MFISTENSNETATLKDAILSSLPTDSKAGLWFPETVDPIPERVWSEMKRDRMRYSDVAFNVLSHLLCNSLDDNLTLLKLKNICEDAFNFPVPITRFDKNAYILETYHGPTSTFKDFGGRFLARLVSVLFKERFTVLVSTSGDTGSAILDAFADIPNANVIVFYPRGRISLYQENQMRSYSRFKVFGVDCSSFDTCQSAIKEYISQNKTETLISANSINIARLLPQAVYYVYSYLSLCWSGRDSDITFHIPCGNCGNITGALIAAKLGVPVYRLVCAQNINSPLHHFVMDFPQNYCESVITNTTAMDVANPSNISRIRYMCETDPALKKKILSGVVSDQETVEILLKFYHKYGILIDPHTAVAAATYFTMKRAHSRMKLYCTAPKTINVLVSTASPCKFSTFIKNIFADKSIESELLMMTPSANIFIEDEECNENVWTVHKVNKSLLKKLVPLNYKKVVFIGMPGSGKTTIAAKLSRSLKSFQLIETDAIIRDKVLKKYGLSITEFIDSFGTDQYKNIEYSSIKSALEEDSFILSPGGSICYYQDLMEVISSDPHILVVYLKAPLHSIKSRIGDYSKRGVIVPKDQTFEQLYTERCEIYKIHSTICIDTTEYTAPVIVSNLVSLLC